MWGTRAAATARQAWQGESAATQYLGDHRCSAGSLHNNDALSSPLVSLYTLNCIRFATPASVMITRTQQSEISNAVCFLLWVVCRECCSSAFLQVLVFLSTCDGVEFHHRALADAFRAATGTSLLGCPMFKLHGNLAQVGAVARYASASTCVIS